MLRKIMAGFICLVAFLPSSCTSPAPDQLPISTARFTPEIGTATMTSAAMPTSTASPPPTQVARDVISSENLKQVRLLHEYWLTVATAAVVDPYQMDISAIAASPQSRFLAVGGCSRPLEADLRSGNIYCNSEDLESSDGMPFLLILDMKTEKVVGTVPENDANTTIADLAFTQNGKKLIYATQPGKFAVWDLASGQIESVL